MATRYRCGYLDSFTELEARSGLERNLIFRFSFQDVEQMKITLITACYNSAETIGTAIESVLSQKGVDVEYIVVDGGSQDGTVDIIKEYADKTLNSQLLTANFTFRWLSESDKGMYDAINKGIKMATGDVIGILNADDVLASDETLKRIAEAFESGGVESGGVRSGRVGELSVGSGGVEEKVDCVYADIRFVHAATTTSDCDLIRRLPTVRYCSGKWFRPWMFRFGTQTAHPSTFFRKKCFAKWGDYSLDYGMYGDFELLCRFLWKNKARMKYLPLCTTVMRLGGASTKGLKSTLEINRTDMRALKANGCWSCYAMLYSRYIFKIWGFLKKTK